MENQLNSIQTIINYNACAYTPLPDGDEFESRQLSQYNIVKLSVKNVVQQVLAQKESCIRLKNLKFSFDETTAQHEHVAYQDKDQVANIIFNLVGTYWTYFAFFFLYKICPHYQAAEGLYRP